MAWTGFNEVTRAFNDIIAFNGIEEIIGDGSDEVYTIRVGLVSTVWVFGQLELASQSKPTQGVSIGRLEGGQ